MTQGLVSLARERSHVLVLGSVIEHKPDTPIWALMPCATVANDIHVLRLRAQPRDSFAPPTSRTAASCLRCLLSLLRLADSTTAQGPADSTRHTASSRERSHALWLATLKWPRCGILCARAWLANWGRYYMALGVWRLVVGKVSGLPPPFRRSIPHNFFY